MSVNQAALMAKVDAYAKSKEFAKKVDEKMDDIVLKGESPIVKGQKIKANSAYLAGGKFVEVLQSEIESKRATSGFGDGKLGNTAVEAVNKIEYGKPYKVGSGKYEIPVYFKGNKYRESLSVDEFDGIDNIVALLNKGYKDGGSKPTKNPVYGVWMGHYMNEWIPALRQRKGAHFIENAIDNFMKNYGAELGVTEIIVSDEYK